VTEVSIEKQREKNETALIHGYKMVLFAQGQKVFSWWKENVTHGGTVSQG